MGKCVPLVGKVLVALGRCVGHGERRPRRLSRAWPTKFVAGEWDNESDEYVIESVTLTYDFFELVQ
jgi:hypothetical protein